MSYSRYQPPTTRPKDIALGQEQQLTVSAFERRARKAMFWALLVALLGGLALVTASTLLPSALIKWSGVFLGMAAVIAIVAR